MRLSNNIIALAMRNYRITLLIVLCFLAFGIYSVFTMPKQEFPEYTIRQGIVVGVFPGATSEEVEEQLAKPLEQYLMTFKEVKRSKTTSTSQNGMCYIQVELQNSVNNKDEVWSKIKHGLESFKSQLPNGVVAIAVNDDFGDTSALLITLESDTRSYRELKEYVDDLSDRLRRIESVTNLKSYGIQDEQISVYVDQQKLSAYGIDAKSLSMSLASQGLTGMGGQVSNDETETPVHVSPSLASEEEVAQQIIWNDNNGRVLRVKDVAKVVREYDESESYIRNNGYRCVMLSMEMRAGFNIVEYGEEVNRVMSEYIDTHLPDDVQVRRIADQSKVVDDSVSSFLRDLLVSIAIIIVVMMLLLPLRSAIVAAITIPLSTFISIGIMYLCGIPLNVMTLAALIVVLGMIVDNSIVVIDGYLDLLGKGHSRWYAAVESARMYFPSLFLATFCICIIFFPLLFTMSGMALDLLKHFPWSIAINLMVSLMLAMLVIPFLEVLIVPKAILKANDKKSVTDILQGWYKRALDWTFRHGTITIAAGFSTVIIAIYLATNINFRLLPLVDREQFVIEVHLPANAPLNRTAAISDSLYRILDKDERITSMTSFVGCSSPRFQMGYAPQMGGKNFAQFIVNTASIKDTEGVLDDYADELADHFPDASIKFKQLDYQTVQPLEFRFYGEDMDSLRRAADLLMERLRQMPELVWVHSDYETPQPIVDVELDPIAASQLGINRSSLALSLAMAAGDVSIGEVWEGDYKLPIVLKNDESRGQRMLSDVEDTHVSSLLPALNVPLRQIADVKAKWSESKIVHRNGMRCITVAPELKRGVNAAQMTDRISKIISEELALPQGVTSEIGGAKEFQDEDIPSMIQGILISLVIIFFFILLNFRKFGITIVIMLSLTLCMFGAMVGLWIADTTIGLTSVFGFITLLGMIMRNGILLYQHAEDKRKFENFSAAQAAYDAGERRMIPIFLTTATTAVGVVPMMTGGSTLWTPVGITIFAGGIGALILVVTVMPVLYSKLYK